MNIKLALTIAGILVSFNLSAEEIDSLDVQRFSLDEVVVRSFKFDANLRTLPVSGSKIDRSTIENQHITEIKNLSALVPNLFFPDYGSKLTSPVYIRGIGSKINSPAIGLYVDGIPYFEKSAFDFDLNEIESMEILRGPQGTLSGRNTMGGLINVYTKSPLQYNETLISASAGNYSDYNETLSHYGKMNDDFGYAISGRFNHSGGYFTNRYDGKKVDESNSGSGRIRLEWQIKPNLNLKLVHAIDYSDQGGYPYAPVDSVFQKPGEINYNDYSSYKRLLSSTGATLIYTTDLFSLSSQTAYQYLSDKQGIDQDFSPSSVYFTVQNQKQSTVSQEINIKSITESWYKWLFGVFTFHQAIDNEAIMEYKKPNYSTRKLYDVPTSGISFYHQSVLNNLLIDNLSLTLGIRYDYEKSSNDYAADTIERSDIKTVFYSKLNFSRFTPKAALRYTFSSGQMMYASVSQGYKTGGFNSSFQRDEDRSFDPEYSWNYEIGSKFRFFENRFKAEISLFYIDWRNQQITQKLPIGQMLKNAGRSESKGAEISLQGNLFKGFDLFAGWGFTQAVFKEYQQDSTHNYAGKYLPLVPKHTFALGIDYQIPLFTRSIDRLHLNLNYSGVGRIYWAEDNKVSQPYYGQLNGKISAGQGIATLSLWAKNITNTEYTAYYFETGGKGLAQKGRPLTWGVSVGLRLK